MISPAQVPSKDIVEAWLYSLGVLCDCDNGVRLRHAIASDEPCEPGSCYSPCNRCVLVEVGGVRVRALLGNLVRHAPESVAEYRKYGGIILPAEEVDDEMRDA